MLLTRCRTIPAVFCLLQLVLLLCRLRLCAAASVNRRMDQWVETNDFDLNTLEVQLEEVGPDGK
jgi:hypothetical protein